MVEGNWTCSCKCKITLRGIRIYIDDWIATLQQSYREADGVVRDEKILREIAHLEIGRRLLTKKFLKAPIPDFLHF